jgi:hypothetical protein
VDNVHTDFLASFQRGLQHQRTARLLVFLFQQQLSFEKQTSRLAEIFLFFTHLVGVIEPVAQNQ